MKAYENPDRRPLALGCGHLICEPCLLQYVGDKKSAGIII
jgi:hypothetical protein